MVITIYVILAIIVTITDVTLAHFVSKRKRNGMFFFRMCLHMAALAEVSYTIGILAKQYFFMKLALAVFFSAMSVMCMCLFLFCLQFFEIDYTKKRRKFVTVLWAILTADLVFELINPFWEISLHFNDNEAFGYPVRWEFVPQIPYYCHLIFCWFLMAATITLIVYKIIRTADPYRQRFIGIIVGLLLAVGMNLAAIALQHVGTPDFSQLSYSFMGIMLYWDMFHNKQTYMLSKVHAVILNELGHPVILFGEDNRLAEANTPAAFLIPKGMKNRDFTIESFLERLGFDATLADARENVTFRWHYLNGRDQRTYRVDFRVITDRRDRIIGRMFVLTETSIGVDLLTGFHSKRAFERYCTGMAAEKASCSIAIFDINQLKTINREYGDKTGDRAIVLLSKAIRVHAPEDAYLARFTDASLVAVSGSLSEKEMHAFAEKVTTLSLQTESGETLEMTVQSGVASVKEGEDLFRTLERARSGMLTKKLMNPESNHSSILETLAQTLLEADETTQAHVMRTRDMGRRLGQRLGLTDQEQADLSLLCLMHDIGKIGIPNEILTKPGRLTEEEWTVMRTHAEKGYRIAKSSMELSYIADCILYHHEFWNGKGYPEGISGEQIPVLSRIIAIIDAYDAMTSDRSYHRAISKNGAIEEIRRCAGTQFDPKIAEEFIALLTEENQ